jgi:hypothetical protein
VVELSENSTCDEKQLEDDDVVKSHLVEGIRVATIKEEVVYGVKSKALLYFGVWSE